jgi:2-(1,2-epoxy-1,2-dihydrophenyl)acetyl-CoA isomerase
MNTVAVNIDSDGVALLELNRPSVLNALNSELMADVICALKDLATNKSVRALIISGRGEGFCSGADLDAISNLNSSESSVSFADYVSEAMKTEFNPMMEHIYDFPKPVISAVNGVAAGGGAAMALCADIVLLCEKSALKVVQVPQLGLAADLGANWLLPRIVGRSRALGICLLGDKISADKLIAWGLAWDCVASGQLIDEARTIAVRLADLPVNAILSTRRLIDNASHRTFSENLEDERLVQEGLLADPSFIEAKIREFSA